jgi:hypothetical protein
VTIGPADLSTVFRPPDDAPPLGFRQGVVLTWNQTTAENTISVGGTVLVDVPCVNSFEAQALLPGDIVGILKFGSAWFVLGRITGPSTTTALSVSDTIATSEATTSGTFGDLPAGVGPQVTIAVRSTAKILVLLSAQISGTSFGGEMSFAVSGASTVAAATARALQFQAAGAGLIAATYLVRLNPDDGLVAGSNTFTAKYRAASGTATFANRNLTVATI